MDQPPSLPAGAAFPIINPRTFEILAAPIMIIPRRRGYNLQTYAHELGHLFGLGHQFERDEAGESVYPSVMGYEGLLVQP